MRSRLVMFSFKFVMCGLFILVIQSTGVGYGQDLNISLDESKTLELDYNGNFNYSKNAGADHSTYNMTNQMILNRSIEKKSSGNWQKVNVRHDNYKAGDYKSRNTNWSAEFGGKNYLANSPFYLYSSIQGSQKNITKDSKNNGVNSIVLGGTGGGRVVDLANYLRAKKVEKALIDDGILENELPREIFSQIISLLRRKRETLKRVVDLNALLSQSGLMKVDNFDIDTTFLLAEIIDESTDRLESGFEGRFGYAHELSRQDKADEKSSYLTGMLKYAKPLTHQLEFSERVDYYNSLRGEYDEKNLTSTTLLKYDVTKTQITGSYIFGWERDEFDVSDSKLTTKTHKFEVRYSYEVYNRVNLSAVFNAYKSVETTTYGSWREDSEHDSGWDRELRVAIGYEIY